MAEHYDVIVIGSGAGGGTLDPRARADRQADPAAGTRRLDPPREARTGTRQAVWVDTATATPATGPTPRRQGVHRPSSTTTSAATPRCTAPCCSACGSATSVRSHHVDGDLAGLADRLRTTSSRGTPGPSSSTTSTASAGIDPPSRGRRAPYPHPADQPRAAHRAAGRRPAERRAASVPAAARRSCSTSGARCTVACIRCDTCDGFACLVNGQGRRPGRLRRTRAALPQRHAAHQRRVTRLETDAGRPHGSPGSSSSATANRGVLGRRRRRVGRGHQLRRAAPALRQRPPPRRARQRLRRWSAATSCCTTTRR